MAGASIRTRWTALVAAVGTQQSLSVGALAGVPCWQQACASPCLAVAAHAAVREKQETSASAARTAESLRIILLEYNSPTTTLQ